MIDWTGPLTLGDSRSWGHAEMPDGMLVFYDWDWNRSAWYPKPSKAFHFERDLWWCVTHNEPMRRSKRNGWRPEHVATCDACTTIDWVHGCEFVPSQVWVERPVDNGHAETPGSSDQNGSEATS
jgi:hypothetical protein